MVARLGQRYDSRAPQRQPPRTLNRDRSTYFRLDPKAYGMPLSEEDFAYTWANLQGLSEFYARAAKAGDRAVVFTVDF